MNAQQADNLRVLIRHMETKCARELVMSSYFNEACGTPACALGEACVVPELRARGLGHAGFLYVPHFDGEMDGRGTRFFGLCDRDGFRLFGQGHENRWVKGIVTPREWATEARKVLAEHGYSMDEATPAKRADDGFSAFMAKVQEPLESSVS